MCAVDGPLQGRIDDRGPRRLSRRKQFVAGDTVRSVVKRVRWYGRPSARRFKSQTQRRKIKVTPNHIDEVCQVVPMKRALPRADLRDGVATPCGRRRSDRRLRSAAGCEHHSCGADRERVPAKSEGSQLRCLRAQNGRARNKVRRCLQLTRRSKRLVCTARVIEPRCDFYGSGPSGRCP